MRLALHTVGLFLPGQYFSIINSHTVTGGFFFAFELEMLLLFQCLVMFEVWHSKPIACWIDIFITIKHVFLIEFDQFDYNGNDCEQQQTIIMTNRMESSSAIMH